MTCPEANKEEDKGPTVYKVKNISALDENLFLVIGAAKVNRIARINRNMVVMRHNKRELTLINPIRLCEDGERRLLRLGKITRIIRLAPRHGSLHDKFYLQRFSQVRRWAPAARQDDDDEDLVTLPVHRVLTEDDRAILPACHVFKFRETSEPECALLLLTPVVGNLLVTADALQSHRDNPHINMPVRTKLAASGMTSSDVIIPSSWIRHMAAAARSNKKMALRCDFETLLRLDFDRLVGASGVMLLHNAKEQAVMAVEQTFPFM